jgi:glutamyl-tRNA synthetase
VYIRSTPPAELAKQLGSYLDATGHAGFRDDPRFARAVEISQEKIHTLADFWPLTGPLLDAPVDDAKARERWLGDQGRAALAQAREVLAALPSFEQNQLERALEGLIERLGCKPREVYQPLRVALTGTTISPGIFESIALLGREETLRRVDAALAAPAPAAGAAK